MIEHDEWFKVCMSNSQCVEMMYGSDDTVAIRDGDRPDEVAWFTREAWDAAVAIWAARVI